MSRYYAFIATAADRGAAIINSLTYCQYIGPQQDVRGRRLVFTDTTAEKELHVLLLLVTQGYDLGPVSSGTDGYWDIWLMVADDYGISDGQSWVGRARRYIEANTSSDDVRGPFSLARVIRDYPAHVEAVLKDGEGNWNFPILAGDEHTDLILVDEDETGEPVFPEA